MFKCHTLNWKWINYQIFWTCSKFGLHKETNGRESTGRRKRKGKSNESGTFDICFLKTRLGIHTFNFNWLSLTSMKAAGQDLDWDADQRKKSRFRTVQFISLVLLLLSFLFLLPPFLSSPILPFFH